MHRDLSFSIHFVTTVFMFCPCISLFIKICPSIILLVWDLLINLLSSVSSSIKWNFTGKQTHKQTFSSVHFKTGQIRTGEDKSGQVKIDRDRLSMVGTIYLFIYSFIYLFIHLFIYSFFCLFI